MQGYVFINSDGEYAVESDAGGFSTCKAIRWVTDLDAATIFQGEHPWSGVHNKHRLCLGKCQALQAEAIRTVKLRPFK